jgi:tetratricopeptide (TPR) repeat protein
VIQRIPTYICAFALFAASLLLVACSTKKNTFASRNYHNLTSRYNGYFYAKESMKDAKDKVERSYVDDYSQVIPLWKMPNTPETKGCYPDLEKAIKKSTMVIERHAITNKRGEEIAGAVKWIDENYIIIGIARYYKGEYMAALDIFEYVSQKYADMPTRYEALLWQAKTQLELGDYSACESLLDLVVNDKACPEKLIPEIKAAYADLYAHTGNYPLAIKYLEEAIPLTKSKKQRTRFMFVLAQMHEKTNQPKKASEQYAKVISMNPTYDMLFNARLNRARLSGSDPKRRTEAKRELEKMLTDEKNNEYLDQIFYTLASIEMSVPNKNAALNYYKKSVAASVGNNQQKALSYLGIGDLYFEQPDYKNAQAYFDSTMTLLPKSYPDYNAVNEKRNSLNNLVRYLNIVSNEDSLQRIARNYGSDTALLYPFIDKLIAKVKEEEKRKKEELENRIGGGNNPVVGGGNNQGGGNNNQPGGAWYFYNPSAVSFGINEFTRKFGSRKSEDNWRRANKESIIVEEEEGGSGSTTQGGKKDDKKNPENDNTARAFYIKNLPLTVEAVTKSNESIADALYNLGSIYKEQLRNNTKSIDAFESLCSRFPAHKYSAPSHFQLYRLYQAASNTAKANEHRDYILKYFPDSEYAEIIKNPNYEVNLLASRDKVNKYYTETYSLYTAGRYTEVISNCAYADTAFGKNDLAPKFDFIRALSLGRTQGTPAMEKALTQIIIKHPKDPIKDEAQKLLDLINKQRGGNTTQKVDSVVSVAPTFIDNAETEFQFVVFIKTGQGNLNAFKNALSDFNTQNFASEGLGIQALVYDAKLQMVVVKKFTSQTKALAYYNLLKTHPEVFAEIPKASYEVMLISTQNLATVLRDKSLDDYRKFFETVIVPKK